MVSVIHLWAWAIQQRAALLIFCNNQRFKIGLTWQYGTVLVGALPQVLADT
jgi:hypothetical protein